MPEKYARDCGETSEVQAGEYPAIIVEVANLGHHAEKDGVKMTSRYWFAFFVPQINQTLALNNFGIRGWNSTYNGQGMLDLKRAATGNEELESKEAEDVDVFDLLGKSVFVKIEEVNGYPRVTGVSKCDLGLQYSGELVAVHKEDFSDPDKVAKLGKFAQKMISESNEYKELQKPIQIDDVTDMPLADVKDAEIEEVNPSAVPF